jgi:PTH2 family peptidyl-tRNA hydrolase
MEKEPKQVIVIRKDLNMRKGKMCSAASHASLKVFLDKLVWAGQESYGDAIFHVEQDSPMAKWLNGIYKKIVVSADTLAEVVNAYEEAKRRNIPCSIIMDAGLTEFNGVPTITCCAIGPDDSDKIDEITKDFKLL